MTGDVFWPAYCCAVCIPLIKGMTPSHDVKNRFIITCLSYLTELVKDGVLLRSHLSQCLQENKVTSLQLLVWATFFKSFVCCYCFISIPLQVTSWRAPVSQHECEHLTRKELNMELSHEHSSKQQAEYQMRCVLNFSGVPVHVVHFLQYSPLQNINRRI